MKILKLPQKYREVLYLYYYEEYSVKEIGIMLKGKRVPSSPGWRQEETN